MKCITYVLALVLFLLCSSAASSQSYLIQKIDSPMNIDGYLDEKEWSATGHLGEFEQYFPSDTTVADAQTEIRLLYSNSALYVGIKCYSESSKYIVNSLRRDYRAGGNDNLTIVFDTFNDKNNAFWFGINPYGVIREGIISNGGLGRRDFDETWDNKWKGEAKIQDGYYTAEMEIPFTTLRFNKENTTWGIGAYRFDTQINEISTLTGIPRNQILFNLSYNQPIEFEEPISNSGGNIVAIPYVTSGVAKDFEEGTDADINWGVGGDMKIGITSGLNLDLTYNPDFSQVEVDQQVTDLSRFEIFFPERRQFFLENQDLFSEFGFGSTNPFFSRRIGTATDIEGENISNDIIGGARLSGKLNRKLRLGLLTMETEAIPDQQVSNTNFTVLALQQRLFAQSNISFVMVNKQRFGDLREDNQRYNRVVGLDYNYANRENTWTGKTFVHKSFSPTKLGDDYTHGLTLNHNTYRYNFRWSHLYVGENYEAEVGFVRRTNIFRINPEAEWNWYPSEGIFNTITAGAEYSDFREPGFGLTDNFSRITVGGQMKNTSRFRLSLIRQYTYLFEPFDPTGTESEELGENTDYTYYNIRAFFRSDGRKPFSFSLEPFIGQYFNGNRYGTRGSVAYRYQPHGSVSILFNYNYFRLPNQSESKQTILVGPRIDYTFSKKLFLTALIQYNSQDKNTNINTRLQWRFAPVSDFYLVFTDNYFSGNDPFDPENRFRFEKRNRTIVAKFTYWLNV